ncbi:type VI secretion system-associated protein TagF [Halomonas sp. DP8Y7-3]|uniref:type VI secretion system-associated protein TagF n=1 Tax=Halomonas sp. DP8Y7-3 TaxID=2859079 RepID=UPI001C9508F7|nr:type VI secretion system-associated protein TagF [Halomonas sp. DP8Y7-3]MBY5929707.1 type VI secretion system-associated protein TagF [Halomonas sp. DP8Y7-3]
MIGFFGKLPSSADFVSSNASHKDVRELDEWVQGALYRLAECEPEWEAFCDALPTCFFHFRASNGYWLVGGIRMSCDASGRRYPLLIFQRLAVVPAVEGTLGVHTLSEVFCNQVRGLLERVASGDADVRLLHEQLGEWRELRDADLKLHQRLLERHLHDVRFCDLCGALSPTFPEFVGSAFALRMQALREGLLQGDSLQSVLPLPAEHALKRPAADLWLHWLERESRRRAKASVLVDDFLRPVLWRFASADRDALRMVMNVAPRMSRLDVLEPFEAFYPVQSADKVPSATLDMKTFLAGFPGQEGGDERDVTSW